MFKFFENRKNKALIDAAYKGNLKKVRKLLEAGADVNTKDEDRAYDDITSGDGYTALIHASNKGHTEIVEALLEAGADINVKSRDGFTALILASLWDNTEVVKALLEAGADVNVKDKIGGTALTAASSEWMTVIFGNTASFVASVQGYGTVKALVEAGADVNVKSVDGYTALISASGNGYTDMVKALLEAGADVNTKNEKGHTALILASREGHTEIVEALLEAGADVNAKNEDGNTALVCASENGHIETVKALADASDFALNGASLQGNAEVVTSLSGTGSDDLESLAAECSELIMQYVFESTQEQLSAGRTVNQEEVTRISVNRAGEVLMRKYGFSEAEVAKIVEISANRQLQ